MNGGTTTGANNIAIGVKAGDALTSGFRNVFMGQNAGGAAQGADFNTAVGYRSLYLNTTGTAGDFHLKDGGASGTVKFKYKTTGTASGASPLVINFPGPILFTTDLTVAFTTEHVTVCSVFYS